MLLGSGATPTRPALAGNRAADPAPEADRQPTPEDVTLPDETRKPADPAPGPTTPTTPPEPTRRDAPVVMAITGIVRDAVTNAPIAGALVQVAAHDVSRDRPAPRRDFGGGAGDTGRLAYGYTARTDGDGRYRVVVAGEGNWIVGITADGYLPWNGQIATPQLDGPTATLDATLTRGASLHGVIRGPEGPVAGMRVSCATWPRDPLLPMGAAVTGADGSFRINGLAPHQYRMTTGGQGYCRNEQLVQIDGDTEANAMLERGGMLTIRVTMKNGTKPPATLVATVVRTPAAGPLPTRPLGAGDDTWVPGVMQATATIDSATDTFVLGGFSGGLHQIEIRESAGNAVLPWTGQADLVENAQQQIDATIDSGVQLRIQVVDDNGAAVPAASITVFVPDRYGDGNSRYATTDNEGHATVGGLSSRPYSIRVYKEGYADTEAEYNATAGDSDLRLVLSKGNSLSGVVTGPDGKPVNGGGIILAHNREVRNGGHHRGTIDRDGKYRIDNVEPGTWTVVVSVQGVAPPAVPITVTVVAGENHFDIALGTNGNTLRGTITLPDGQPAAQARVTVESYTPASNDQPAEWRPLGTTSTDATGAWSVSGLPSGRIVVRALHTTRTAGPMHVDGDLGHATVTESHMTAITELTINRDTTCDLRLRANAVLRATLIDDATGGPAVAVGVRLDPLPPMNPRDPSSRTFARLADGKFEFSAPPGEFELVVTSGRRGEVLRLPVTVPGEVTVHVPAPPAEYSVTGTLVGSDGKPVAGAFIMMEPVPVQPGTPNRWQISTDVNGTFRVPAVPAGEWAIRAMTRSGSPLGNWPLTVAGDINGLQLTSNLQPSSGFTVGLVEEGSNAARAGIQVADIIVEYNAHPVSDTPSLIAA
ncbi:MAG: carboxypeptidase regulatory-like domain-containing protein, partial [Planctomycetota bacterium]